jgi:hypothetical protein
MTAHHVLLAFVAGMLIGSALTVFAMCMLIAGKAK